MSLNKIQLLIIAIFLLLFILNIESVQTQDGLNSLKIINQLLPENGEIPSWIKSGSAKIYTIDNLFDYINGAAEIYLEYNFKQVLTQEYVFDDQSIKVDIYEMIDPTAAFGIFSIQNNYQKPEINIGFSSTRYDYFIAFWQNQYYVVISGYSFEPETQLALEKFAQNISNEIGQDSRPPGIPLYLPSKYLIPRSVTIVKGILGLNSRIFLSHRNILELDGDNVTGTFGVYEKDGQNGQLLAVQYSSSKVADQKMKIILNIFSEKYSQLNNTNKSLFKDSKGLFYSIKVIKNSLYIVFRSNSPDMINIILGQDLINYHQE